MTPGTVVWITGLPASGKSKLGKRLAAELAGRGIHVSVLDGDEVRAALVPAPGYSPKERQAFYETLAGLAALLAAQGAVVLVPATAHLRAFRERAREMAPRFLEVWVDTPIEECRARDPKGLYGQAAAAATLTTLPGVGEAYEPPLAPDAVAHGGEDQEAVEAVLRRLEPLPSGY